MPPKGIVKWTGLEDQVVLLYATGHFTYDELAARLSISLDKVKRILSDPRAEAVREMARQKIREGLVATVEDELPELAAHALRCVRVTLTAEIAAIHPAKANQDKVALQVLKGLGYLSDGTGAPPGGITLSPEQHKSLIDAITRADRVSREESEPIQEAILVDNDDEEGE